MTQCLDEISSWIKSKQLNLNLSKAHNRLMVRSDCFEKCTVFSEVAYLQLVFAFRWLSRTVLFVSDALTLQHLQNHSFLLLCLSWNCHPTLAVNLFVFWMKHNILCNPHQEETYENELCSRSCVFSFKTPKKPGLALGWKLWVPKAAIDISLVKRNFLKYGYNLSMLQACSNHQYKTV